MSPIDTAHVRLFISPIGHASIFCTYAHRFPDIASYLSKVVDCHLFTYTAGLRFSITIFGRKLDSHGQRNRVWLCLLLRDDIFRRFGTIPTCDRQTDGHKAHTALA